MRGDHELRVLLVPATKAHVLNTTLEGEPADGSSLLLRSSAIYSASATQCGHDDRGRASSVERATETYDRDSSHGTVPTHKKSRFFSSAAADTGVDRPRTGGRFTFSSLSSRASNPTVVAQKDTARDPADDGADVQELPRAFFGGDVAPQS